MARSTYIYLLFYDNIPSEAYTVKHELIDSLPPFKEEFLAYYTVLRFRDNNTGIKPVDITQEISEEAYER
jgi:hypothetical protein